MHHDHFAEQPQPRPPAQDTLAGVREGPHAGAERVHPGHHRQLHRDRDQRDHLCLRPGRPGPELLLAGGQGALGTDSHTGGHLCQAGSGDCHGGVQVVPQE